ncbi:MAG: ABC transporter substrate-binding protein [bacterium]|nr:ABC transporter substrate-binding protein [bacterium]
MKRLILLMIVALSLLMVAGSSAQTPIRFFLTYIPNIQFSPVYVMDALGELDEAGYELQLEHGDEPVGVDLIATGDFDFGMISGEQVLMARFGQRPVVMVYNWFQKYPVGIVIPSTTPATTFEELRGLKIGVPGRFGASYSGLTAILTANGMTETDIQLEVIGFAAADVVCSGGVDASAVYINNEPLQIQLLAEAGQCGDITGVSVIPISSVANMVSNGIVTSEALIAENPELVSLVVGAFDRALLAVIQNPAEAYLISLDYVDGLPITDELRAFLEERAEGQRALLAETSDLAVIRESREAFWDALNAEFEPELIGQIHVLLETIKLWEAQEIMTDEDMIQPAQLGYSDETAWAQTAQVLVDLGMLPELPDYAPAYTNDFLPVMP